MISIAIATLNRADELRLTLESMRLLDVRGIEAFEIIVVDNGSSDETESVAAEFEETFAGRLRYCRCGEQGLSHARNRAIAEARFPIIAFLDDDVQVHPGWLRTLADAYASGNYAAVGGKAYLIYPHARPRWLSDRDEGLLSKVDHGEQRRIASAEELFGLNLSLRREWLDRVGLFRTDLGRTGTRLLGGEETELLGRMSRAGATLLYEPAAVVGHRVAPERLRRRWFLSRIYWGFRSEAQFMPDDEVGWRGLARMGWYAGRAIGACGVALGCRGPRSPQLFAAAKRLAAAAGKAIGIAGRMRANWRSGGHESFAPSLENSQC